MSADRRIAAFFDLADRGLKSAELLFRDGQFEDAAYFVQIFEKTNSTSSFETVARKRATPQDDGSVCCTSLQSRKLVGRPTLFRRTPPHRVSRPVSRVLCGAGSSAGA
jgi:hypothetical protein